ncbi:MAG: hypothetical protein Kow00114_36010 [Kiloniellaceae bacterium]
MAKLLSTRAALPFEPADQKGKPEAERVSFLLRVPTPYLRPQIDRAVRAAGARTVSHFELLAMLERGVSEVFDLAGSPDVRDRVLGAIAAYRERLLDQTDAVARLALIQLGDPEVEHAAGVLRREYPPFAEMEADRDFHWEAWRLETARHCVVGWENLPRPFTAAHHGGPDDAALAWLAAAQGGYLTEILMEFERRRQVSEDEAKNSGSSSPIEASPGASTSAATNSSGHRKARGKKTSGTSAKSAGRS